ncbi:Magnesium chelatase [Ammonifex degensii KC4]|uniref:Mg-protoporphyrin IX chelatase n=1 Tax=Ammonifex degensii (strain DSM 10501 / KC4) TaxID=429009 RepID=C9R9L1_AMMDK|nr:putative cobaltochelatase [Ammonifex degensii]ACX52990.1 Magnesium chelatase [Ammonifex degensii KC4]
MERVVFPFTALIGQEKMRLALLLCSINPRLGGVLIRGEKGTAKSTAVRGLAALLPEITVVAGCPCNCDPFQPKETLCPFCQERLARGEKLVPVRRKVPLVELPVSATEDRVVGSLDWEYALQKGKRRFAPGILARANRGIIYVDEVNLLDDHLVDVILDAAASGINVVEREGVTFVHPANFILVGTMNPEEGELRPQFLDRFGLCVPVESVADPAARAAILRRREEFEADPLSFLKRFAQAEAELREKIVRARQLLPLVRATPEAVKLAVALAQEANVAGHRAEIIMVQAARALAALEGEKEASEEAVRRVAELVLYHRRREIPPPPQEEEESPEPPSPEEPPEELEDYNQRPESTSPQAEEDSKTGEEVPPPPGGAREKIFAIGEPFAVRRIEHDRDRQLRRGSGRRSRTKTSSRSGRYVRAVLPRGRQDIAFDATLRAAAPYQPWRRREGVAVAIEPGDLREKEREKRIGNFLLFVVDASGSMGAQQRMVAAKGAIFSLLLDAYQKRDKVGMVVFKGERAEVVLPPTNSVELAHVQLKELPTGGRTPLAAGLLKAYEVARSYLRRDPDLAPLLIVVSDGRANVSMGGGNPWEEVERVASLIREESRIKTLVVDVEQGGFLRFGLARRLADALGAYYCPLEELKAESLLAAVRKIENLM